MAAPDATWITKLDEPGSGLRVAVKDAIDVEGVPTTVGCAAVADRAKPAAKDAPCVVTARAAGARLVGKANLHELCYGTSGVNPWFGTPVNPADPARVPGGSSSGSAVAVATEEADVGFGTDTGGSVRLPAACCGIVGLKTTWGRVPLDGVWPLSPALDTVGPLARDVAGVVAGMTLLDPAFRVDVGAATTIGRVRRASVDPDIEAAIDAALRAAEFEVIDIDLPGWEAAQAGFAAIIVREAWEADAALVDEAPDRISPVTLDRLRYASFFTDEQLADARAQQERWKDELRAVFDRVELVALPTLVGDPPLLEEPGLNNELTGVFNLPGTPGLSVPVPRPGAPVPASLQLIGPWNREDLLCATGARVESAVGVRGGRV